MYEENRNENVSIRREAAKYFGYVRSLIEILRKKYKVLLLLKLVVLKVVVYNPFSATTAVSSKQMRNSFYVILLSGCCVASSARSRSIVKRTQWFRAKRCKHFLLWISVKVYGKYRIFFQHCMCISSSDFRVVVTQFAISMAEELADRLNRRRLQVESEGQVILGANLLS